METTDVVTPEEIISNMEWEQDGRNEIKSKWKKGTPKVYNGYDIMIKVERVGFSVTILSHKRFAPLKGRSEHDTLEEVIVKSTGTLAEMIMSDIKEEKEEKMEQIKHDAHMEELVAFANGMSARYTDELEMNNENS